MPPSPELDKHGQIVKLLKAEHGMTYGFANLVAHHCLHQAAGGALAADDLVATPGN